MTKLWLVRFAHSWGFVRGSEGNFLQKEHCTHYSLHGKFHNIIITLYFQYSTKWQRSIDEMISNMTFAGWVGWVGTNPFHYHSLFQYPSNIIFLSLSKKCLVYKIMNFANITALFFCKITNFIFLIQKK